MFTLLSIMVLGTFTWFILECRYDKPFLWYTWNGERKYIRLF